MAPKVQAPPAPLIEAAQIIINLRNNPSQICIRYGELKAAVKAYAKLTKDITKDIEKGGYVTLSSESATVVALIASVEAWSLMDMGSLRRMMAASQ